MTEPRLDHVVLAAPNLADLVSQFRQRTGIDPAVGGRHEQVGTMNYLVGLGGMRYLELIGPDPSSTLPGVPSVFGIDRLDRPRVAAWMIHPHDLDGTIAAARASGYDLGPARPMTRRTPDGGLLSWRLALPPSDGPISPLLPGLIDWQDSPHPAAGNIPTVQLVELTGRHPDPPAVTRVLTAMGVHLDVQQAPEPGLTLVLETPSGTVSWQ